MTGMDISRKIKLLRESRGINQAAFAKALYVSQATVSRWEAGASPKGEHLQLIASYFSQSVDELCGLNQLTVGFRVRVLGSVEAGHWVEAMEFFEADQYEIEIPKPKSTSRNKAFGLEVHGTSMNLHYPDGTVLVCVKLNDLERDLRDRDHVIAIRKRGGEVEATCKEVRMTGGEAWLWPQSSDPKHQTPIKAAFDGAADEDTAEIDSVVIGAYIDRS